MFHMEQFPVIGLICCVSFAGAQQMSITASTQNPAAAEALNKGMTELFLGCHERAAEQFDRVIREDPECAVAYAAAMLAERENGITEKSRALRGALEALLPSVRATPMELLYLNVFLALTNDESAEALRLLEAHCAKYRADLHARCWMTLLKHYAPGQQEAALSEADALYAAHPESMTVCFLRALAEEWAEPPTETARAAAAKAAELFPGHPRLLHLHAHLLFRAGEFLPAAEKFTEELALCEPQGREGLRILLYKATALWCAGKDRDSLAVRQLIRKHPLFYENWEARTLPLRVLLGRQETPSINEISAALKVAMPKTQEKGECIPDNTCRLFREVAENCLRARRSADRKEHEEAYRLYLTAAEKSKQAERELTLCVNPDAAVQRSPQACKLAVAITQRFVVPGTEKEAYELFRELNTPPTHLRPPLIPTRSAPMEKDYYLTPEEIEAKNKPKPEKRKPRKRRR